MPAAYISTPPIRAYSGSSAPQRNIAYSYDDFEQRVAAGRGSAIGTKQERIRRWVLDEAPREFRFGDVRNAVVGVGDQTIRLVLRTLRDEGVIESVGTGPGAYWRRLGVMGPQPIATS